MKAVITIGISASGKTTWAKEQKGSTIISRDDIRRDILRRNLPENRDLFPGELWGKWKWKDENKVTEHVQQLIAAAASQGKSIILADTNLVEKYRILTEAKLKSIGYEVEYKEFPITFEEACKRDAGRPDGVGIGVLWKQFTQWYAFKCGYVYQPNTTKPKAVMFDIDGTLAEMNGRGPFEWGKVDTDDTRIEIVDMLRGYYSCGYKIIIMSGRDSAAREKTEKWLKKYQITYHGLFMRLADDMRKDAIIKEELFRQYVADNYNVRLVVDDRPQVVRAWQLMGLKVAAVANQYTEF